MTKQRVLPYPEPGDPCNGCGDCCLNQLCPVALKVLDLTPAEADQPCPLIDWDGDVARCGVITKPEQTAPILSAIHGPEKIAQAASLVLTVGSGCTSEPDRASRKQYNMLWARHEQIKASPGYKEAHEIFPVDSMYIS